MLNVFITTDVEIWCDGWTNLEGKFRSAFERYIIGATDAGEYGLRYQAALLKEHGLVGVFFVEPLFSGRFGSEPLADIVNILRDAGQDVQLHLHTEWLDEWPVPLLPGPQTKRQLMRQFSASEQKRVIYDGARRLVTAGASTVNCFRAGSFGFNADTIVALAELGIPFDSSYNATAFGLDSGVAEGSVLTDVYAHAGVVEFPMAVFDTGFGRLRHVQLGACSWPEIEGLLWQARELGRQSFVLLSHNFELLSPSKRREDPIVVDRFERMCRFLDKNRSEFRTCCFQDVAAVPMDLQPPPLKSSPFRSAWRIGEQIYRRRYA